jgi:hypothetical protein
VVGSADKVAGFALGALLDGDRDASGIRAQVAPELCEAVRACLAEVSRAQDKHGALAALIRKLRPEPRAFDALPEAARRLLQAAQPTRSTSKTGWAHGVYPDLLAMLKRLAAQLDEKTPA